MQIRSCHLQLEIALHICRKSDFKKWKGGFSPYHTERLVSDWLAGSIGNDLT